LSSFTFYADRRFILKYRMLGVRIPYHITSYLEVIEYTKQNKAFFATKNAEATEDEQSIQKKLKQSANNRQFTNRERAHWHRTRGTKGRSLL
jgi:hypothetical protein